MGEQLGVRSFGELRCSSGEAPDFPGWKRCLGVEGNVAGGCRRKILSHLYWELMVRPTLVLFTLMVSILLLLHHSSLPGGEKNHKNSVDQNSYTE